MSAPGTLPFIRQFTSALRLFALTLMMIAGFTVAGSAQNAPPDGQSQPGPPPVPDPGTTSQLNCIGEDDSYVGSGKAVSYMIRLENKCEKRMRCEVFAYVVQSKGPSSGHAVLTLAPKSEGQTAKKSYPVKVKQVGGLSQVTRECRVF
jgi:hypothetical protein